MNPVDQDPQIQAKILVLKESHANESCKLNTLRNEVEDIESSLAEIMNFMKKRLPSHQEESPITSEEDHEVVFIKETKATTNDVRDGYSTSSTSSSSTGFDISRRDKTAEITLKNVATTRARDTFIMVQTSPFLSLWLPYPRLH